MMARTGDNTIIAIIKRCARKRWTTVALCALACGLLVHVQVGSVAQLTVQRLAAVADDGDPVLSPRRLVNRSAQPHGLHSLNASAQLASHSDRRRDSFVHNPRHTGDPNGEQRLNTSVQQASHFHGHSDSFVEDLLHDDGDPKRDLNLAAKLASHEVEIPLASQNNGTSAHQPSQRGGIVAAAGVKGRLPATRSRRRNQLPTASSQPLKVPRKKSAHGPSAATPYPLPPDPEAASRDLPRPKVYLTPTRFYDHTPPPFPQLVESAKSAEVRERGLETPGTESGTKKTASYPHYMNMHGNISAPARREVPGQTTTTITTVTPLTTLHAVPSQAPKRHTAKYDSPPPLPLVSGAARRVNGSFENSVTTTPLTVH